MTVTVGAAPAPDLVVEAPAVSESAPAAGARFTLSATVRNQGSGSSAFTTLRYYQSTDPTITSADTEVGTDSVSSLDAAESGDESISLTAPSSAGTYYYGACVDAVSDESDTTNNCSPAVTVTVGAVTSVPGAPAGLTATVNGQTQIDLSWIAPPDDGGATISGYLIEVSTDSSTWSDLDSDTRSTTTTYSHTGLTAGSTRHYRVSAINSVGTGPASNSANATTDALEQAEADTCATGEAVSDPANNTGLVADCEILLAARDTLRGTATLNWSADVPITDWDGITIGGTPQRVTRLKINRGGGGGLAGRIPAGLGGLNSLTHLDLQANQITGSIPAEIGNMRDLVELRLWGNSLTGSIPSRLGNLNNLKYLELGNNQLRGTIPRGLGNLIKLEVLGLYQNQFSGTVPPELGRLTRLRALWLNQNRLTGIPTGLGHLTRLGEMHLDDNQLTGSIPADFGNLESLWRLSLSDNQLTGSIPAKLGSLTKLKYLTLNGNQLTGCVPSALQTQLDMTSTDLGGLPFCDASTAPSVPTSLTATPNGQTRIDLAWTAPSSDGGADVTGYRIEVSTGGSSWSDLVADTKSTSTSYSHTGLTAGSTRHYRVSAINSEGAGPASNTDSATTEAAPATKPGAPTGLTATADGQTEIDLAWTAPSDDGGADITGYRIEVSTDGSNWSDLVANTRSTSTSYAHTGLTAGSTRHYRVSAINSQGTGPASNTDSATTEATPATKPGAPTGLTAIANGQTQIDLSWTKPSNDGGAAVTGYKIEVSTDGSSWSDLVANTGSTTTSYSHTGLTAGATRHYRVSAINSAGAGPASNTDSATTEAEPVSDATCTVDLIVKPGESCAYPGTSTEFSVDSNGTGQFLFASSGSKIELRNTSINGITYTFVASKQSDGNWLVEEVG